MAEEIVKRGLGWQRDKPDFRDRKFSVAAPIVLPPSADLRAGMPPIYDQGSLGSCTANAIGAAYEYDRKKQFNDWLMPSRLFIYFNERKIEHTIPYDSGAQIRDGVKVLNRFGVCKEASWPYIIGRFAVAPPPVCYREALDHKAIDYSTVWQTIRDIKTPLVLGYPVIFGFTVYESFEGPEIARTGIMKMPQRGEHSVGGHAVLVVGYDDAKHCFIVRNSWGRGWGDHGHFYMPYDYISDTGLCSDFWVIKVVS